MIIKKNNNKNKNKNKIKEILIRKNDINEVLKSNTAIQVDISKIISQHPDRQIFIIQPQTNLN